MKKVQVEWIEQFKFVLTSLKKPIKTDKMKTEIYKGFKISVQAIERHKVTNGRGRISNKQNGNLTTVKQYTIEYLGEVTEFVKEMGDYIKKEEFKSMTECKKYIDDGYSSKYSPCFVWLKMITK